MFNSLNLITNNYFLKQKLKVPEFQSPIRKLTDSWQGNIESGQKIINRKLTPKVSLDFNKFEFLRDLKSEGSVQARTMSRSLVKNWIDENYNLLSKEFSAEAMVSRITSWSFNYSWFAESGKLEFQKKLLNSIALQTKYLELKLINSKEHLEKIIIIKGIIVGQSILYPEIINIKDLLDLLDDEIQFLINPDGGHKTRSPVLQIELLRHLIEIRSVVAILKNVDAENLHKQTIKCLTTSRAKIDWRRFWFAFLFWGIISSGLVLVDHYMSPENYVFNFKLNLYLNLIVYNLLLLVFLFITY